jgi:hypothetical protein
VYSPETLGAKGVSGPDRVHFECVLNVPSGLIEIKMMGFF